MARVENVANAVETKQYEFHKLYGDAPEMEVAATGEQISSWLSSHPGRFQVFAVPREYPVGDFVHLPGLVLERSFSFSAQPGEFYVFQVVLWTQAEGLGDVRLVPASCPFPCRCFNLTGRRLNVPSRSVQPLWCGVEIPSSAHGDYALAFRIETENAPAHELTISLRVSGEVVADFGEGDDARMARLRWLDSNLGREETVFAPYRPIRREGRVIRWLGHDLTLAENGLPGSITSYYTPDGTAVSEQAREVLNGKVEFGTENGENLKGKLDFLEESDCAVRWRVTGTVGTMDARLEGTAEFDGTLRFAVTLHASEAVTAGYSLRFTQRVCGLFMGLNRHGGPCPERMHWNWNRDYWQDGYWMGEADGGLALRLLDGKSQPPLVNAYYHFNPLHLPRAWDNQGRGGIDLLRGEDGATVRCFSGDLVLNPGETADFSFELQVTPFHPVEFERFFREHYYHPIMHRFTIGGQDALECADLEALRKEGVTCLNVHHAVGMNPIINYPFGHDSLTRLSSLVERAHKAGLKVLLYYTIRELTVHCPEFWALWSLQGEVFYPGLGVDSRPCTNLKGPHPWLCSHLNRHFIPAWAEVIKNGEAWGNVDLALETTPGGRLENFYLEGLRYLLQRVPLDGLYLDDSSLSVEGFRRLWRIFLRVRGCSPIIDFHGWNPFSFTRDANFGHCSVLLRDLFHLPYMTDLWLGENVDYEAASPEYYLTELSGLPFGLSSEMLRGGGNPWRGMLYGMTCRYGWSGDPRPLWKFFQDFGTEGIGMNRDWTGAPLCRCDKGVFVTRFTNDTGKRCFAVASWAEKPATVTFDCPGHLPEIPTFQAGGRTEAYQPLTILPGKGLLLVTEPTR